MSIGDACVCHGGGFLCNPLHIALRSAQPIAFSIESHGFAFMLLRRISAARRVRPLERICSPIERPPEVPLYRKER